ncbi:MAG TPA: TonB-dependent receptor [Steroidobacteraceae bacterium]|nr:TonB-dependent receptor [Steroidobacteraceae bacterium]
MPAAYSQERTAENAGIEEIVVTAQKRAENLQDVPVSIQALGTAKLEELHITNFDDYAKFLPSVSFLGDATGGPGFEHVYMRGVSSSVLENHSGSLPTVGVYLDEQPVTTIDGVLDIHIYDIARIEVLAGPQGTLYGASSEAGTIRIITNKPDTTAFAAGYELGANTVDHGGIGGSIEGFLNVPLSPIAAIRLVAWDEHKAGFIDVVPKSYTFPTSGITFSDAPFVKKDANYVDTRGGRMALKLDLNDNWTMTPSVMGQVTTTGPGPFAYNPAAGDLDTWQFFSDETRDSWMQSTLTIEGKISDFDIVYSGGYLARNQHESEDYTDYSLFYDRHSGEGAYFRDNAGHLINPAQHILGRDHYTKISNELRVTSPKEYRFRFTAGVFLQRQLHNILQDYVVNNGDPLGYLPPNDLSVQDWPGSLWVTDEQRVDRDAAVFGEANFDFTDHLTGTAGIRHYTFDNTLYGFYGFGAGFPYGPGEGVLTCFAGSTAFRGAPCVDLDGKSEGSGNSPKLNLSYKFDPDHLMYVTWSKGFRPGGVNRNGGGILPPYLPDYLTNYEVGWKTTWFDHRLRFNGAVFDEEWKNFQFSFLGPNAITIIQNAGQARIKGIETDLEWAATQGLTLSGGFSLLDSKLTEAYCPGGPSVCLAPGQENYAPSGTQLPTTPKFKGDVTARYTFAVGGGYQGNLQASVVYNGPRWADLRIIARDDLGEMPSYTLADFTAGIEKNGLSAELYINNAFDSRAVLSRYAECDIEKCGQISVYNLPETPRLIGIRFGQKF